jgi:hypothetical protein
MATATARKEQRRRDNDPLGPTNGRYRAIARPRAHHSPEDK